MRIWVSVICMAVAFSNAAAAEDAKPAVDTKVYHIEGKNRVHVKQCRRLVSTEATTVMTLVEAEAKGLPLCSRCPGSTTQGKGNPEVETNQRGEARPSGDTTVYYAEGKKRVHVKECRRLLSTEGKTVMTLAEAEAKGLPLCSRCPGSTTEGKGNAGGPESWVNPPPSTGSEDWNPPKSPLVVPASAPLVSMGDNGRLVYKPYTDKGDRIIDFSYSGYERSEVPIPDVPVVVTLGPPPGEVTPGGNMAYATGTDSFKAIQSALDKMAAVKPDKKGFRGAVLLKKGTWHLSSSLNVSSGVILRGEGDGPDGTVLIFTIPSGDAAGVRLGNAGTTAEELKPVTGQLTKGKSITGEDAYFLTLDDGYCFNVADPKFKPDVKLEGYVGSRVTLTMKAIVTTRGEETSSRLKHNMPYEVERVEAGQAVPPLDPNLKLPEPAYGSANATESLITDAYVPTGGTRLTLKDASGLKPGDLVNIVKATNTKWIEVLGVGERLRHIRGGKEGEGKKPWGPQKYNHLRRIREVNGNTITIDVPLPQSIVAEHGGGTVRKVTAPEEDSRCGVEHLRIVSNYDTTVKDSSKSSNFRNLRDGIDVTRCRDSWVRNCSVLHVWKSAVQLGDSRYCTVRDCKSLKPVGPKRGGRRYPFSIDGSCCNLVYNCLSEDGRHDFVIGSRTMGPNAFLKCSVPDGGNGEPHHRWGVGTLWDNVVMPNGGALCSFNRGDSGSGHGWAGANSVFWNCNAPNITVFDPETEGENNFSIGYTGPQRDEYKTATLWYANTRAGYWGTPQEGRYYGYASMGSGHIESPDKPVKPDSLFEQQLIERIGREKAMQVLK